MNLIQNLRCLFGPRDQYHMVHWAFHGGGIFHHGGIFPHSSPPAPVSPPLRRAPPPHQPAAMRSPAAASAAAEFSDALTSPTSPAATPSHPSSGRHFYLAVDRLQFKMRTLLELLGVVADRRGALPIAVCVSSRDELDLVCADVASLSFVSLSPLYSDQAEPERASVLDKFRQATIQWNHTKAAGHIVDNPKTESADSKLTIVVATDACLPQATLGEAPLMARVLINYELPTKKEAYFRRMLTCLAADGIVINMVVGGEVATLKALEETSGLLIAEMPIHVSEIL